MLRATTTTSARRCLAVLAVFATAVVAVSFAVTTGVAPAVADPVTRPGDGMSAATAAASCWAIKRDIPTSPSGTYWLLTPALDRPAQYHCDQETDGGGWVLVARGRANWSFANIGQSTPTALRTTTDGPGAFPTAALPSATIDGLVNGASIAQLTDGIRIERSLTTTGSNRQEVRFFAAYDRWTWSFPSGKRLAKQSISGIGTANGNTRDTYGQFYDYPASKLAGKQGTTRIMTWPWVKNGYRSGFGYGSGVSGSTSTTSHLYKTTDGYALPFTRVWLRPRISNSTVAFAPVPATGLPADPNPRALKNRTEVAPWGVVGLNHAYEAAVSPWANPATVIKAYGARVFVGGRFTHVQKGPGGAKTAQGSLAAFDLDGTWISTFRPVVRGRVWDMTLTADNKLIIGGDFTSVNGIPNTAGMAALNPTTGAVITSWKAHTSNSTGPMIVRALDRRGSVIYAAGRFDKVVGGSAAPLRVSSAISLSATNGTPGTWRPALTGSAIKVRAATAGDRVYLAGFFTAINANTAHAYFGITSAATGAPVTTVGPYRPSTTRLRHQQAVAESGNQLLIGGSQHTFQTYDRNRTTLIDANITRAGGDTQAIEAFGSDTYMACHCDQSILQGTNSYAKPAGFRSIDPIMLVGRFDSSTHQYDTSWFPSALKGAATEGVWSLAKDARGCLWVAGDLVRGAVTGNAAADWLGGFGRFCPADSTPPTAPADLQVAVNANGVDLRWTAATDASGAPRYDILRDDRVIATVWGTSYADPVGAGTFRYTVRATDASGNRSATPAPLSRSVADVAAVATSPPPSGTRDSSTVASN